jgi:hypothetical protein
MTPQEYFRWFRENWEKTGLIVGLFLTIYLVVIVLPQSTLLFAVLMSTPIYMLHQTEEHLSPGGFARFMNKDVFKADPVNGPCDRNAVFVIDMAVWIAMPLYSLWAITDIHQMIWMPYFYILQAVIHLVLGIVGKRILNPGMVTSWLVHVPWAIWTIGLLVRAGAVTNPYWNSDLRDGLMVVLYMAIGGLILNIRYRLKLRGQQRRQSQ